MRCQSSIRKVRKANIPKAIREQVWLKSFGKVYEKSCYVHWCDNIINVFEFHVGHDTPESKGGTLDITNLKPICARCNLSMSDNYTIQEWQKLTPLDKDIIKLENIDKKSMSYRLRKKSCMNCF